MPTPRFLEPDDDRSSPPGQTRFLDLTNGKGGTRADGGGAGGGDDQEEEGDETEEEEQDGEGYRQHYSILAPAHQQQFDLGSSSRDDDNDDVGGDGGGRGSHEGLSQSSSPPSTTAAAAAFMTHTTLEFANTSNSSIDDDGGDSQGGGEAGDGSSRIVVTGTEHTGRWTKEEHEAFLTALQKYGKEWKKVAAKVKTRTVVQTRTHAQKYFQKLQKTIELKGGSPDEDVVLGLGRHTIDMMVSAEQPKKSAGGGSGSSRGKRKKEKDTSAITITAATTDMTGSIGGGSNSKVYRRGSAATMSAAQVISTLSNVTSGDFGGSRARGDDDADTINDRDQHGRFATPLPPRTSSSSTSTTVGWLSGHRMKIVAPDPALSRSQFPEPSPAATGKRKLAEMAAARMLAGVGSPEGPPTPPPPPAVAGVLRLRDAPPPPFGGSATTTRALQIVNPESLGVTYKHQKRGDSPVTPWDGELEAWLVSATEKTTAAMEDDDDKPGADCEGVITTPQSILLPINGPPDAFERTPLHQAVCSQDVDALRTLLDVVDPDDVRLADTAGYTPLHSACAMLLARPNGSGNGSIEEDDTNDMVSLLLAAGADLNQVDDKGNCPLHWAARAGDSGAAEELLQRSNSEFIDCQNSQGETPLHWAMRAGAKGIVVVKLLLSNGAKPGLLDRTFRRAIDVAVDGFLEDEASLCSTKLRCQGKSLSNEARKILKLTAKELHETRSNFLICSAQSRTLVLHHPECLEHHTKSQADWEAPDRVRTIMKRILPSSDPTGATETSGIFPHEVTVSQDFERGSLDLLSRVHSKEYLTFVNNLSKDLERRVNEAGGPTSNDTDQASWSPPPVVPFTPMVQRSMIKIDESNVKLSDNSDTSFSVGSLRAARRAAGAVQHAVDSVLLEKNRNAFCVVRPPGHHAGINGLLEGGESCGFCIFNNVAAGALYAISEDKLQCNRCAIVDIDVHHGNGTEEIVRKCHDPSKLFFFSIHLYDNDKEKDEKKKHSTQFVYKFYPGTGSRDDLALNIINVPICPLWKDAAPAEKRTHNTRNKTRSQEVIALAATDDDSEPSTPRFDVASDTGSSSNNHHQLSHQHAAATSPPGRLAYRQAIQNRLLPALRAFNPDLILISAGFDAAKGDVGNARHEKDRERVGLDLEPEDYAWTTRKILEIADICCRGRVVSVLEGGYGRTPVSTTSLNGANATRQDLDRGIFGECAVRHLHSMIDPYDAESRFS